MDAADPGPMLDIDGLFVYYDKDGDGRLTRDEFLNALRGAGGVPTPPLFEQICEKVGVMPDVAGFKWAVDHLVSQRPSTDDFVDRFRSLSQAGRIDAATLKYIVAHYGDPLSEAEVQELLLVSEIDKDNLVDVRKLGAMLLEPPPWMPKPTGTAAPPPPPAAPVVPATAAAAAATAPAAVPAAAPAADPAAPAPAAGSVDPAQDPPLRGSGPKAATPAP
eukprot:TRINITY_DN62527_c0_g1_i1.p1 TRINITY_DN62527_c0_g1~~TRINITY_DN62527_c0_g1_i1.p1  ORF type:complete len:237 (+),score=50.18 TRINITY_DN62527_c0_g1_i1:56-712(+)